MLLYTTVGVRDLERAIRFYDAVFTVFGHRRLPTDTDGWAWWGHEFDDGFSFCVCMPFDGKRAEPGNGVMFALRGESAAQVREFYEVAIAAGGQGEGAPGTRALYEPSFYVAYVRDPDGNKVAAVFHRYDASEDA